MSLFSDCFEILTEQHSRVGLRIRWSGRSEEEQPDDKFELGLFHDQQYRDGVIDMDVTWHVRDVIAESMLYVKP